MLRGLSTLQPDNLPDEAIAEFRDGDDLETSLWADGDEAQHRRDVFLSLVLAKRSIGPLSLALLWQDDENIGEDLGTRIVQSGGQTPYIPGRRLHYHVSNPTPQDARRLLLAASRRNDMPTLTREAAFDLIEDAHLDDKLPTQGLDPTMEREIARIVNARCIDAQTLRAEQRDRLFDIRPAGITHKIVGATLINEADVTAYLHRQRIGNENVFTLYCTDGTESKRIARALRTAGYRKPRLLVGGFNEWARCGFEIEPC